MSIFGGYSEPMVEDNIPQIRFFGQKDHNTMKYIITYAP